MQAASRVAGKARVPFCRIRSFWKVLGIGTIMTDQEFMSYSYDTVVSIRQIMLGGYCKDGIFGLDAVYSYTFGCTGTGRLILT